MPTAKSSSQDKAPKARRSAVPLPKRLGPEVRKRLESLTRTQFLGLLTALDISPEEAHLIDSSKQRVQELGERLQSDDDWQNFWDYVGREHHIFPEGYARPKKGSSAKEASSQKATPVKKTRSQKTAPVKKTASAQPSYPEFLDPQTQALEAMRWAEFVKMLDELEIHRSDFSPNEPPADRVRKLRYQLEQDGKWREFWDYIRSHFPAALNTRSQSEAPKPPSSRSVYPHALDDDSKSRLEHLSWPQFTAMLEALDIDRFDFSEHEPPAIRIRLFEEKLSEKGLWQEFWEYIDRGHFEPTPIPSEQPPPPPLEADTKPSDNTRPVDEWEAKGFSPNAWRMMRIGRRLGAETPRSGVLSSSRLFAALLWDGLHTDSANASAALVQFLNRDLVHQELLRRYPLLSRYSDPDALLAAPSVAEADKITLNLHTVLEKARRLATETHTQSRMIAVRHLVGAFLSSAPVQPNLGSFLASVQINPVQELKDLIALLPRWNVEDSPAEWRRILYEVPPSSAENTTPSPSSPDGLPDYASDTVDGKDALDIKAEVNAMAALASAWSVEPPLSIGLFGEWGSGKSFFMRKMKNRVAEIAKRARAQDCSARESGYFKNIVQVEFNAWHYVEGKLWASLVEQIFRSLSLDGLNRLDPESEAAARKKMETLLRQLQGQTLIVTETAQAARKAHTDATTAEDVATQKEGEADVARTAAKDSETARLDALKVALDKIEIFDKARIEKNVLWDAATRELIADPTIRQEIAQALAGMDLPKPASDTVRDQRAVLELAESGVQLTRMVWKELKGPGKGRFLLWIVVITLALVALFYVVPRAITAFCPAWSEFGHIFSNVVAIVAPAAIFIKRFAGVLRKALEKMKDLREKREKLDAQAAQARRDQQEELARKNADVIAKEKEAEEQKLKAETLRVDAERKRAEAREKEAEAARARQQADAARAEADRLRLEVAALQPDRRLADFIADRAGAQDYRQHLGLPALIRRDFEKLSELFDARRSAEGGCAPAAEQFLVDRIILYIDDLDRCPPKVVVEVLRAIHMLLAFPLFIVVVAVDARWMKRSLHEEFPLMLRKGDTDATGAATAEKKSPDEDLSALGRSATPDDYLEKIFQVTFWVRPLNGDDSKAMMRDLIQKDRDAQPAPSKNESQGAGTAPPPQPETKADDSKADASTADASTSNPAQPDNSDTPDNSAASHADVDADVDADAEAKDAARHPDAADASKRADVQDAADDPEHSTSESTTSDPSSKTETPPPPSEPTEPEPEPPPNPRTLLLSRAELDQMETLAPVVGRSPRTVKRFVNCYRLLKVTLKTTEAQAPRNDEELLSVMFLLAIVIGLPEHASKILEHLGELGETSPTATVATWVKKATTELKLKSEARWEALNQLVTAKLQLPATIAPLTQAIPLVDRFSFNPSRKVELVGRESGS